MKKIPFHPFLIALFPPISVYLTNRYKLAFSDTVSTMLFVLAATAVLWGLVYALARNWAKSAAIVSVFLFLFFSFRHLLNGIGILAYSLGHIQEFKAVNQDPAWLYGWLALCLLLWGWISLRVVGGRWPLGIITPILNAFALALIAAAGAPLLKPVLAPQDLANAGNAAQVVEEWKSEVAAEAALVELGQAPRPDIYYIILDGYARDDILSELYGLDNSEFLSFLEDSGFYVARNAHTNYSQTYISLASSLNMEYLDEVGRKMGEDSNNIAPIDAMIQTNRVIEQLRKGGYTIAAFSTGYHPTQITTADIYLTPEVSLSNYQNLVVNATPISLILVGEQYRWHRDQILYTLDHLPDLVDDPAPTFTFAHIFAPHPPFVLGPNGEPIHPPRVYSYHDASDFMEIGSRAEYIQGYHDQTLYLTRRVEGAIAAILERSPQPPIIILQSDHGPGSMVDYHDAGSSNMPERMSILYAVYFSGQPQGALYPDITPVNTFRVLFDRFFDAELPLLPDRSYFVAMDLPYQPVDVTDRLPVTRE